MIDLLTSNEIVKHRALGFSFDEITKLTSVSKPTVMKICEIRNNDINEAKHLILSGFRVYMAEAVAKRKMLYNTILEKAGAELLSRDMCEMKPEELASLISKLERSSAMTAGDIERSVIRPFTAVI